MLNLLHHLVVKKKYNGKKIFTKNTTEVTFERAAFTKAVAPARHQRARAQLDHRHGVAPRGDSHRPCAGRHHEREPPEFSNAWGAGHDRRSGELARADRRMQCAYPRYFYRLDRNSQATYTPVGWTATTGRNVLLTQDADGRAISSFGYYLHSLVAEDRFGNIGSAVAHYRIQVAPRPRDDQRHGSTPAPRAQRLLCPTRTCASSRSRVQRPRSRSTPSSRASTSAPTPPT